MNFRLNKLLDPAKLIWDLLNENQWQTWRWCIIDKEIIWLFGWLFGFYGVSTLVGYLMPNSVYMYIPFTNECLVGNIFYKQDFTCLHMINQF